MLCANRLNHASRGWSGMPGHVRQNDTDLTLLQEELNAPIFRRSRDFAQLSEHLNFETFSELLLRLNTYMSINSIEVRIHLNYRFNLRLSNFVIRLIHRY